MDSALPGSFSDSSLGLGTGWNLSRTGGVKMEAFTDGDSISSVLAEPLQAEGLFRKHARHGSMRGTRHTGPSEKHTTKPRLWDGSRYITAAGNPSHGCLLKAVHCSNVCDCVNLETIQMSIREQLKKPWYRHAVDYSTAV